MDVGKSRFDFIAFKTLGRLFLWLVLYTGEHLVKITSVQCYFSPIGINSRFPDCFFFHFLFK